MLFYVINLFAHKYHENDLFHGDIKPDNIFYIENNCIDIKTDLGSLLYLGKQN